MATAAPFLPLYCFRVQSNADAFVTLQNGGLFGHQVACIGVSRWTQGQTDWDFQVRLRKMRNLVALFCDALESTYGFEIMVPVYSRLGFARDQQYELNAATARNLMDQADHCFQGQYLNNMKLVSRLQSRNWSGAPLLEGAGMTTEVVNPAVALNQNMGEFLGMPLEALGFDTKYYVDQEMAARAAALSQHHKVELRPEQLKTMIQDLLAEAVTLDPQVLEAYVRSHQCFQLSLSALIDQWQNLQSCALFDALIEVASRCLDLASTTLRKRSGKAPRELVQGQIDFLLNLDPLRLSAMNELCPMIRRHDSPFWQDMAALARDCEYRVVGRRHHRGDALESSQKVMMVAWEIAPQLICDFDRLSDTAISEEDFGITLRLAKIKYPNPASTRPRFQDFEHQKMDFSFFAKRSNLSAGESNRILLQRALPNGPDQPPPQYGAQFCELLSPEFIAQRRSHENAQDMAAVLGENWEAEFFTRLKLCKELFMNRIECRLRAAEGRPARYLQPQVVQNLMNEVIKTFVEMPLPLFGEIKACRVVLSSTLQRLFSATDESLPLLGLCLEVALALQAYQMATGSSYDELGMVLNSCVMELFSNNVELIASLFRDDRLSHRSLIDAHLGLEAYLVRERRAGSLPQEAEALGHVLSVVLRDLAGLVLSQRESSCSREDFLDRLDKVSTKARNELLKRHLQTIQSLLGTWPTEDRLLLLLHQHYCSFMALRSRRDTEEPLDPEVTSVPPFIELDQVQQLLRNLRSIQGPRKPPPTTLQKQVASFLPSVVRGCCEVSRCSGLKSLANTFSMMVYDRNMADLDYSYADTPGNSGFYAAVASSKRHQEETGMQLLRVDQQRPATPSRPGQIDYKRRYLKTLITLVPRDKIEVLAREVAEVPLSVETETLDYLLTLEDEPLDHLVVQLHKQARKADGYAAAMAQLNPPDDDAAFLDAFRIQRPSLPPVTLDQVPMALRQGQPAASTSRSWVDRFTLLRRVTGARRGALAVPAVEPLPELDVAQQRCQEDEEIWEDISVVNQAPDRESDAEDDGRYQTG